MKKQNNTLRKKLYRDMSRAAMQFLSIILLCALGTFVFAALDGTARMVQDTLDQYFEENQLAHFWITVPDADRAAMDKVSAVPGVKTLRARSNIELDTTLEGEPSVSITAYDGDMDVNIPLLREGALLDPDDKRGCLIEERFAAAQNLTLGDWITVKLNGQECRFIIRGICVSPEYIVVSDGMVPNPDGYGYILTNACAIPEIPLTQIVVRLEDGIDEEAAQAALEAALPNAMVVARNSHMSTRRAQSDAQLFANLTYIFPILCYAIAALIVMTTLSRMIDNQRLQIGTLKALGFSKRQIRGHYLSYAIVPSMVGATLGTVVGHTVLPAYLWDVMISQHEMPYQLHPPISTPAWVMTGLSVLMSIGICMLSYHQAAKETTASLLRPKPPKDGKRILLERITLFWKNLSFNGKMIVRNLMRNKLRTFMSFVGILACTMLITASMGLQDSVTRIAENHYTRRLRYDVRADLKGDVGTAESYERRLEAEEVECIMEQAVSLRAPGGTRTITLSILGDEQSLQYLGEDETYVELQSGGVAVTYKLTKTLDISLGDRLKMYLPGDDEPIELPVLQIVHSNVSQGVYMNRSTWEAQRKGDFVPSAIQLVAPSDACLALLEEMDEVDQIDYPADQIVDMLETLESLSSVFMILTFVALGLAFVICYNMGLMNFVERLREYATLKVLGYHQKEIRNLILLENIIITILGVVGGIWPGSLLTDVILHSAEPESGFYPGFPTVQSIIIACSITFCFSIFIQLLLTRKVKTIDMVEALKSVE